jgi:hypothetical protein
VNVIPQDILLLKESCVFDEVGLLGFTVCVLVKYLFFVSVLCAVHIYRRFAACVTLLVLYVMLVLYVW